MAKPRNPNANNNMATARVSDITKAELRGFAAKTGLTLSEVTRKTTMAGLPIVESEIKKHPK